MTAERKTPETDKMYDMVSNREAPNYNMVGHLPSKWSYEAILDLTDFARRLERQRDAAMKALRAEVDGMREDAERYLLERKGEDIWLHVNAGGFRAAINLGHRGAGNFFQRGLEACAAIDAARKEAK